MDGRRICSQPERNEIRSVLLVTSSPRPSLCLRLETHRVGNRYTRLACLHLVLSLSPFPFPRLPVSLRIPSPPLFLDSTFGVPSRRAASPLFSRLLFADGILFRKKYPLEPLESVVIRSLPGLGFPSSLFRARSRLRSRRLRLKGPLLRAAIRYLLYMLFLPWRAALFLSLSLCSALVDIRGIGLWFSFRAREIRGRPHRAGNVFIYLVAPPPAFPDCSRATGSQILLLYKQTRSRACVNHSTTISFR